MANEIDLYTDLKIAERNLKRAIRDKDKAEIKIWKREIRNTKKEAHELYPDLY